MHTGIKCNKDIEKMFTAAEEAGNVLNVRQSYCARYTVSITRMVLCQNGSTYRQTVFTVW